MAGFTTDLLTGLAVELQAAGIGSWDEAGIYADSETGIVLGNVPQSPPRIITLSAYGVSDHPTLSDSVVGVQVRCRWEGEDPRPVDDLADRVYNHLHGKVAMELTTGVVIIQCLRQSASPLGQDANKWWSNVQNFYASVWRPSTNRT